MFIDTNLSSRGYAVKDARGIFGGVDIKTTGVVALFPFVDLDFRFLNGSRVL